MSLAAASPRTTGRAVAGIVAGVAAAVTAVATLAGCGSSPAGDSRAGHASGSRPRSAASARANAPPAAADAAARFRSPRRAAAVAVPVRLRIPSIGLDAPMEKVGLDPDGAIAAPRHFQDAAWYSAGPRPGQPGPAVLLGHVDSRTGPAVFYRLAGIRAGSQVLVDRADGTTARFRVRGSIQVAKSRFPADLVYAPTLSPSLRLVTCGGSFDPKTGHYRDNVVVSALPEVSP
jgi:sortase (surface protein transpeptidase)